MVEDLGERTEEATPKRLAEARAEGRVAKSHDLAAAIMLLLITLAMWAAFLNLLGQGKVLLSNALTTDSIVDAVRSENLWVLAEYLGAATVRVALPILLLAWGAAYVAHLLQIGWLFAPKAARPSLQKINPINGFKRIFGMSGLVRASLDSGKVLLVLIVAALTIIQHSPTIVVLPYSSSLQGWQVIAELMLDLAFRVVAVLVTVGVLDYLYQRWKHTRDLRMTRQQVKDELKQTEGDPDVKRRRSAIQKQVALQRISVAVPKADVIITNPEHVSVAIAYDAEGKGAPRVIAKGADFLALKIRFLATQHNITIVQRPPLARAIYKQVQVNQEIPPEFYKAVAEILAYVYQLSGRKVA